MAQSLGLNPRHLSRQWVCVCAVCVRNMCILLHNNLLIHLLILMFITYRNQLRCWAINPMLFSTYMEGVCEWLFEMRLCFCSLRVIGGRGGDT